MNELPISEGDLQAYIDGRLPGERRLEIERWLAENPAAASRLRAYAEQGENLRQHFAPILDEPLPESLRRFASPPALSTYQPNLWAWRWPLPLAAALLAVLAATVGWLARGQWPDDTSPAGLPLARQAAVAHAVYSPDLRRPVEVGADQEEQLVRWLSKRLGLAVRAPKLGVFGYELVGGRLLPGNLGPVAQFMYQDSRGGRLTLYVSPETSGDDGAGFRFAREGEINVFYWRDGPFAYALSASVARPELAALAGAVYEQFESR